MKIKEIIVVEGRDDTARIKLAVDADTIETNGSAIGDEVIRQIRLAQETRGVIVLTDPDFPGRRSGKPFLKQYPAVNTHFCPNILPNRKTSAALALSTHPLKASEHVWKMCMKRWRQSRVKFQLKMSYRPV